MNMYRVEYFNAGGRRIKTIQDTCKEEDLDLKIKQNMPTNATKVTWDMVVKNVRT